MSISRRLDTTAKMLREQVRQDIHAFFQKFTHEELIALAKGDPELLQRAIDLGAQELFERQIALMSPEEAANIHQGYLKALQEIAEYEQELERGEN